MTGVRVWSAADARPAGAANDFAHFFAPVLPRLRGLWWLLDQAPFQTPLGGTVEDIDAMEARLEFVAIEGDGATTTTVGPHWTAGPGFVPDYAAWMSDDWNGLYGLAAPPPDWRAWLRELYAPTLAARAEHLRATAEVCLFAIDHAYWELFAQDAALVEVVREWARDTPGLAAALVDLADSAGL